MDQRRSRRLLALVAFVLASPLAAQSEGVEFEFVDSESHAFTAEERAAIERIGREAVRDVRQVLEGVPEVVSITVQAGPGVIPETGDGGVALAPGQVGWTVDPTRPGGVVAIAETHLRPTLFHEVHHLARGWTVQDGTAGTRMIDAAVAEGLATAFARDETATNPPWGHYDASEAAGWVEELREIPHLGAYQTWMFQHPDGRRWIGYRAGTYIADQAKAGCGCSAADLAGTPTDEVMALIGGS